MAAPPDPWNWSVEDVQHFFRDAAVGYIADLPHGRLPPLDPFLTALKGNEVDGTTLLTIIDSNALRDDCGVTPLAHRSAIIHSIVKLRRQSTIYNAQRDPQGSHPPAPLPFRSSPTALAPETLVEPSTERTVQHARQGEIQFQDSEGRKRRKLAPTTLEIVRESEPTGAPGYLGDRACPIDEIFYGKTAFGSNIGDLHPTGDILILDADRHAGLDDCNFQFVHQRKPVGESRFVHSQILHFLTNEDTIELVRGSRPALAVLPYRDTMKEDNQSATVLRFTTDDENEEPSAVREKAAHLNGAGSQVPEQAASGQWGFLNQKHDRANDALPLYGDSESDDGESATTSSDPDGEMDGAEESDGEAGLSHVDAATAIDTFVRDYIDTWKDNLPDLEKKRAWTVWKKMKQSRTLRDELTLGAHAEIDRLTARLARMKERFLEDSWANEGAVRQACGVLEPTIGDREEQRWMITVWKRRQEPGKAANKAQRNKEQGDQSSRAGAYKPGLQIHPDDRFSVSPAPIPQDDTDYPLQDAPEYDADDEVPPSPRLDPAQSDDDDGFLVHTPRESVSNDDSGENTLGAENELVHEAAADRSDQDDTFNTCNDGSESQDLPSPSTFVPRSVKTPKSKSSIKPIDLTMLSSSDYTSSRKRGRPSKEARAPTGMHGDPADATVSDINTWSLEALYARQDFKRILIKLLYKAGPEVREQLASTQRALKNDFPPQVQAAVRSRRNGAAHAPLPSEQDHEAVMYRAAELYMQSSLLGTPEETLDSRNWDSLLELRSLVLFNHILRELLAKNGTKLFNSPKLSLRNLGSSAAPIDVSSDLEEIETPSRTPHKTRKKEVRRSAAALNSRASALNRQKRYQESQISDSAQLVQMVALNPDESHNVEINPARGENDEPIYIPQKVAHAIKAHQLDGVRFLWREIACDGQEEGQGCILAHTMGLGKSMQTIALLAVLNHATKSKEPSIIRQLPFRLQKLANAEKRDKRNVRVLVICPPGLIPNWRREINDWTPGELGVVFSIEAGANGSELSTLKEWKRGGGVMLIGFQKFRNLLKKKANETADQAGDSEEFTDFERLLFKRPEIVVVDEAHQIKNTSAYVTELAGKIKTHHRIALTGTPMSNKVDEIYSLVSWVAPQFLGDPAEFRAHFTEPIKQGLFVDSTAYERRNSLKKLRVLHAEIGPKVNRANIEVLRGQLKGKIEYVIKVPLSEVQDKMYRGYIKALQAGNRSENASQVTIFAWLNNLTLLTNHPHLFRKMLLAPPAKKKKIKKGTDAEREQSPSTATQSGSVTPLAAPLAAPANGMAEISEAELAAIVENDEDGEMPKFNSAETDAILDGWEDSLDSRFSAKLCVIMPLIDMSLDCGDNVLVFSTSLPTLDYLCELFRSKGRRYAHKRIDGSVKTADRMSALEQLNQGHIRIMLLSTKAAGVGLNMCSANRVIIVDSKFNPADEEQAIGRAYRIGQLKPVFVYRVFTGGSYDENLKALQIFKSSLTKRVVDKKNPRRDTERNARNYLYEPKEVEQEDLTKWIGKDPDVLDKLLQQHGSEEEGKHDTLIRSIDTMETLQEDAADAPLDEAEQKEVNDEIEMNKRRPRGRWAAAMEGLAPPAPPSTMPAPQRVGGGMASLQAPAAFLRGLAPRMASLGGLPSSTSG